MQYVMEYLTCALFFLVMLTVQFYSAKRFPGACNRLFGVILYCAIADLSLDLLGSVVIMNIERFPLWAVHCINGSFYFFQAAFPALMMIYALLMADRLRGRQKQTWFLYIPCVVSLLLLLSNSFTNVVFFVQNGVYTRGPAFNVIYSSCAFYIFITLAVTVKYRKRFTKTQFNTLISVLVIILAAVVVQFMYPRYLLTGVAVVAAIYLMYFTLENPDSLLDCISGAFNYHAMQVLLHQRLQGDKTIYVMAAEIDGLRRINSLFSLEAGNQVLISVASFLMDDGKGVWVFRTFGNRFVCIAETKEEYTRMVARAEARFAQPWLVDSVSLMLTATIRYFSNEEVPMTEENAVALIDAAFLDDEGEYRGVATKLENMTAMNIRRRQLVEMAMRSALEDDRGFSLCFQPVYSMREKRFTTAEVLLRFSDYDLGFIMPDEFILIAERSGLIPAIDEMVIRRACAFIREYEPQKLGIEAIHINLSAAEFLIRSLPERVMGILAEYGVRPAELVFEVTETAATVAASTVETIMREMGEAGFRFALDDFGTGYANFTQVINLPFYEVKLDRSLLYADKGEDDRVLASIMKMLKRLGKRTVIEGAETAEQVERARLLEADHVQGFYYAKPMAAQEFIAFLKAPPNFEGDDVQRSIGAASLTLQ